MVGDDVFILYPRDCSLYVNNLHPGKQEQQRIYRTQVRQLRCCSATLLRNVHFMSIGHAGVASTRHVWPAATAPAATALAAAAADGAAITQCTD